MNKFLGPVQTQRNAIYSNRLSRSLSCISQSTFVELDMRSSSLMLTSHMAAEGDMSQNPCLSPDMMRAPGDLVLCEELCTEPNDIRRRATQAAIPVEDISKDLQAWHSFRVTFADGVEDRISVLPQETGQAVTACGLLATIWPILREDCLRDLCAHEAEVCDEALQWTSLSEINFSILIMNKEGVMLRANTAAKRMLDREIVLRRTTKGIRCVDDSQTRMFRNALAKCALSDPMAEDQIVFLNAAASGAGSLGQRIPVTFSRFYHQGAATDLVTVTMPLPPDSRRVERLARAGGLTPAEARIAALLQMGLSNKDMAMTTGLKEQSVSTYAKRVLNKLNVNSRAEMAQMLTWQAAGGRLT